MDNQKINKFKARLLSMSQEIAELESTGDDAAKTVELDQARVGRVSRMDALQGQAMQQEIIRRRKIEQQKITSALQRIENDDYGFCVTCGEEITIKRLELDPSAPLCIDCANKAEQDDGPGLV